MVQDNEWWLQIKDRFAAGLHSGIDQGLSQALDCVKTYDKELAVRIIESLIQNNRERSKGQ